MTPPTALTKPQVEWLNMMVGCQEDILEKAPLGSQQELTANNTLYLLRTLLARSDALARAEERGAVINDNWQREAAKIAKENDTLAERVKRLEEAVRVARDLLHGHDCADTTDSLAGIAKARLEQALAKSREKR